MSRKVRVSVGPAAFDLYVVYLGTLRGVADLATFGDWAARLLDANRTPAEADVERAASAAAGWPLRLIDWEACRNGELVLYFDLPDAPAPGRVAELLDGSFYSRRAREIVAELYPPGQPEPVEDIAEGLAEDLVEDAGEAVSEAAAPPRARRKRVEEPGLFDGLEE